MHQPSRDRFVYFDMGNVLVHFDHEIAVEQMSQVTGCSSHDVRRVVFEDDLQHRYETGLIDGVQFVTELSEGLEIAPPPVDAVLDAASCIFSPNEEIEKILQYLKERDIPMGILSNTCQAHWQWLGRQSWAVLGDWFDSVVLSYEVRSMKPDTRIYSVSETKAGVNGARLFFTDDRAENVQAAQLRGWSTYQFGTVAGLWERLEKWLAEAE